MIRTDWISVSILFSSNNKTLTEQQIHNSLFLFRNLLAPKYMPLDFYNDFIASNHGPWSHNIHEELKTVDHIIMTKDFKFSIQEDNFLKNIFDSIDHLPAATRSYMKTIMSWVENHSHIGLIDSMKTNKLKISSSY